MCGIIMLSQKCNRREVNNLVNVNKLKGAIVERALSVEKLADMMGIDTTTLYRKLKNPSSFTLGEADKIVRCLHLTANEGQAIFFSQFVA